MKSLKHIACAALIYGSPSMAFCAEQVWEFEVRGLLHWTSLYRFPGERNEVGISNASGEFRARDDNNDGIITVGEVGFFYVETPLSFGFARDVSAFGTYRETLFGSLSDFHYSPTTGLRASASQFRRSISFGHSIAEFSPNFADVYEWTPATSVTITLVPEPKVWAMLLAGLVLVAALPRKHSRQMKA